MTASHPNQGFELLQGPSVFSGKILGGCVDSMYDFFDVDATIDADKQVIRFAKSVINNK